MNYKSKQLLNNKNHSKIIIVLFVFEGNSMTKKSQNDKNLILIKGLKKSYGSGGNQNKVLKGLSCQIKRGTICTLLGPSGSGKSTLLNIIGGIETADSGQVQVGQFSLAKLSNRQLSKYRRQELGFIFQFYNLVPNLTVAENIEVGAYLSKNPLNLSQLIEDLGMTEHQRKFPNQLSGGQQQRTAIGRALVKQPTVLLCDEPTGALDYQTGKDVLGLLQKLNQDYGTTIVIATHNTAIAKMSHQILKLHDGVIVEDKQNKQVLSADKLDW